MLERLFPFDELRLQINGVQLNCPTSVGSHCVSTIAQRGPTVRRNRTARSRAEIHLLPKGPANIVYRIGVIVG